MNGRRSGEGERENRLHSFERDSGARVRIVCGIVFPRRGVAYVAVDEGFGTIGGVLCDGVIFRRMAVGYDHADGAEYPFGGDAGFAG